MTLASRLGTDPPRTRLIAACTRLIAAQVKRKGLFVRSAYATITAIKHGIVPEVLDAMLDAWLAKLQPHHDAWQAAPTGSFADHLVARGDAVAEDLLAVTDARAAKTSRTTAKKLYARMRASAKANVIEALPELGRVIEEHLDAGSVATAAELTTAPAGASRP